MPCASPDLRAYAWQPGAGPMLAPTWTLCRPERRLPQSRPYLSLMLALSSSHVAQACCTQTLMGPMLTRAKLAPMLTRSRILPLCWPHVGFRSPRVVDPTVACPYVGPILLTLGWWPYLGLRLPRVVDPSIAGPYVSPSWLLWFRPMLA